MNRSKRMQPVKRIAGDRADQAARLYAERRRQHEEQQQRLAQLEIFRGEYRDRLRGSGHAGMGAFQLRNYGAFMARIDVAVNQQKEAVRRAEQDAESSRLAWVQLLGRAQAIGKVIERAQVDERRTAERKQQRLNDELPRPRRPVPGDR